MVQALKINEIKVGKITVSVWRDTQPAGYSDPKGHHDNFKIEVDSSQGWVCVGGGAKGSMSPGNFLTASFPADDFGSWIISSRDHTNEDWTALTGYAIGMKIDGLNREALMANLKIFPDDSGTNVSQGTSNPSVSAFVKSPFTMLLGGGFQVLDQPPSAGTLCTGSYPDSTFSWKASSKDHGIISPTRIRAYAIGIKPTLTDLDGTPVGNVITTFHSSQALPGSVTPFSEVEPLGGYALCGGGAVSHYAVSMLIWCLEPTPLQGANSPNQQRFGGGSALGYNTLDWGPVTAYAMGIKLGTDQGTGPLSPEGLRQLACDTLVPYGDVRSPATADGYDAGMVNDNDPNSKWVSTEMIDPSIQIHIPEEAGRTVCRVEIAWADGNVRKYWFRINISTDNFSTQVFAGQSSGKTISLEKYEFPAIKANDIIITITHSHDGKAASIAQISKIVIYGRL